MTGVYRLFYQDPDRARHDSVLDEPSSVPHPLALMRSALIFLVCFNLFDRVADVL